MSLWSNVKSSFTESAIIGGIAAASSYAGLGGMIASGLSTTGVANVIPPQLMGAAVVFGIVFASDMVYNLWIAN